MTCDMVAVIRVVDPNEPGRAFVSECIEIENPEDACDLARADLPAGLALPAQALEFQIALYPRAALTMPDGAVRCPDRLIFGVGDNFPVNVAPAPALGGRTYTTAAADEVVVELGCADLGQIAGAACLNQRNVEVVASVDDFDSGVFVPPAIAGLLTVRVGEPRPRINPVTQQPEWSLDPAFSAALPARAMSPVPTWADTVPLSLERTACIQVLEEAPQATASVHCSRVLPGATQLDLRGIRLARPTLAEILDALDLPSFPESGLVIGVVLDFLGNPVPGASLIPSAGTVRYLSADRQSFVPGATTTAGIFMSDDAPFDAAWSVFAEPDVTVAPVGGLIAGKVTVMIVTLPPVLP